MNFGDPVWEKIHSERLWGVMGGTEILKTVSTTIHLVNHGMFRGLDIGCGSGAGSWPLAKEGGLITMFEGSESALKKANHVMEWFGIPKSCYEMILGDIAKPFNHIKGENMFDMMLDNYSLVLHNPREQVNEAINYYYKLLRPGGLFFIHTYGTKSSENPFKNRGYYKWYERDEVIDIIKATPFKIVNYDHFIEDHGYNFKEEKSVETLEKHLFVLQKQEGK